MFSLLADNRMFLEVSVAIGSPTNNVRETLLRRGRSETLFFLFIKLHMKKKKEKILFGGQKGGKSELQKKIETGKKKHKNIV